MKIKLITSFCALAILFGEVTSTLAYEDNQTYQDRPLNVAADAVAVRPGCFIATVLGTALFILVLPVAATSRSVKKTADTLVVHPAKATFTRPLGDFSSLE